MALNSKSSDSHVPMCLCVFILETIIPLVIASQLAAILVGINLRGSAEDMEYADSPSGQEEVQCEVSVKTRVKYTPQEATLPSTNLSIDTDSCEGSLRADRRPVDVPGRRVACLAVIKVEPIISAVVYTYAER